MQENNNIQLEEPSGSKFSAKTITAYAALAVFCAFMVYYGIMALMSPGKKISSINSEFGYKAAEKETVDDRLFSDSSFVRLNRKKTGSALLKWGIPFSRR